MKKYLVNLLKNRFYNKDLCSFFNCLFLACFIYGCSTKNISNKNEEDYITNKMINDDNNISHSSASILDKYGNNDLHRSAKENNYSFIKNFIDSFSNNDFHFLLAALEAKNFAGETALYILAKNSCLDTI